MTLEDDPSLVGQSLLNGKLVVERKIGEGGMGVVYRVQHQLTSHARALKVLHAPLASSSDVVKRFLREASVAGQLECERVVETFDAGVLESGAPYVLMELLEGEPLDARLAASGTLEPHLIARFAIEACEGLVAAHAGGIVHRDLKPENLFLVRARDGSEHVKILDFGISKFHAADESLTATGNLLGTPMYMSPEQTEGAEQADARSDIYAIGVVLYEALAGRPPFDAPSLPKLIMQVHLGEHRPLGELAPDLDPALIGVVEKAMAHDPADRYASASALIRALEPFTRTDGAPTPDTVRTQYATPRPAELTPTSSRGDAASRPPETSRPPIGVVIAVGLMLALLAVLAAQPWQWGGDEPTDLASPVSPDAPSVEPPENEPPLGAEVPPVEPPTEPAGEPAQAANAEAPGHDEAPSPDGAEDGEGAVPAIPTGRRRRVSSPPASEDAPSRADTDGLDTESPY